MLSEKIAIIKKDLRRLRKVAHSIDASMQAKERYEARIEYIKDNPDAREEIEGIRHNLNAIKVDELIKEATALEDKYLKLIGTLDEVDRTIVIESYINGKSYWKIGKTIGYSEAGVRKRLDRIFLKLAQIM